MPEAWQVKSDFTRKYMSPMLNRPGYKELLMSYPYSLDIHKLIQKERNQVCEKRRRDIPNNQAYDVSPLTRLLSNTDRIEFISLRPNPRIPEISNSLSAKLKELNDEICPNEEKTSQAVSMVQNISHSLATMIDSDERLKGLPLPRLDYTKHDSASHRLDDKPLIYIHTEAKEKHRRKKIEHRKNAMLNERFNIDAFMFGKKEDFSGVLPRYMNRLKELSLEARKKVRVKFKSAKKSPSRGFIKTREARRVSSSKGDSNGSEDSRVESSGGL